MKNPQVVALQQVIRQIKFDKKLTQHQVADILNISRNGLDRFMTNRRDKWKDIEQAVRLHFSSYYSEDNDLVTPPNTQKASDKYSSVLEVQKKNIALLEELGELKDSAIYKLKKELEEALSELDKARTELKNIKFEKKNNAQN